MRKTFNINACLLIFLSVALFYSSNSQAIITCTPNARTDTMAITPMNISAGSDLPLGSVIYRGTWYDSNWNNLMRCTSDNPSGETGTVSYKLGIDSSPYPLSSWSGSPYGGNVYNTNIPGIGIAVWYAGNTVTTTKFFTLLGNRQINIPASNSYYDGISSAFDISLVKIGPTPTGNYAITGSSLPVVKYFYTAGSNVAGLPITVRTVTFSGSLNVSAQTCTTPEVNVNLGTYDTSSLTSVGSATPWIDSSIRMTNCPKFQGYFNNGNPVNLSTGSAPTSTSNQFGVTLTPISTILDAANGIMSLTPSPTSATGVGIQIAQGTSSTTSPALFDFNKESMTDLPKTGDSDITYPLVSRYIKMSPHVTPGPADGKVTFTLNYY